MSTVKLPKDLRPTPTDNLIRVGNDNDGGYVVSKLDIAQSNCLISLGINDDWSFEKEFSIINPQTEVKCFDGSVSSFIFLKRAIKTFGRGDFAKSWHFLVTAYLFHTQYLKLAEHVPNFVGFMEGGVSPRDAMNISKKSFVKIDIEGHEYRLLELLLESQVHLTGLAIEFHDCDLHIDRIRAFNKNLDMMLVSVHANNCAPIDPNTGLPHVLECVWSLNSVAADVNTSEVLSMPNDPFKKDYYIEFQ